MPTPPATDRAGDARPILYHGVEKSTRVNMAVTLGVYPDGRSIGTVARALGASWSPDGTRYAYLTPGGASLNVSTLDGDDRTLFNTTYQWRPIVAWPEWSPDGSRIAIIEVHWCGQGSRVSWVVVLDSESGKTLERHGVYEFWAADADPEYGPGSFSEPEAIRWSPDGTKLLVSWDSAVVIDLANGDAETISDRRVVADWAPSGDAVYYFQTDEPDDAGRRTLGGFYVKESGSEAIQLMDADGLAAIDHFGSPGPIPVMISLSPTGSMLAVTAEPPEGNISLVKVYGLASGDAVALDKPSLTVPANGRIVAIEWSPEEGRLAAVVVGGSGMVTLELLDLAMETWTTLATPVIDAGRIDLLRKVLSWG